MEEKEKETQENVEVEKDEFSSLSAEQLKELVISLRNENEELKKEADKAAEYKDSWYRAKADFENFKKRNNETRRLAYEEGKTDLVKKILSIGDNLERAVATSVDEKTKQGLEMLVRNFQETLTNVGVSEINPLGEQFDPNKAEAVMMADAENGEESGSVKQVFLKGYAMGDKIIRFAQVVVIK